MFILSICGGYFAYFVHYALQGGRTRNRFVGFDPFFVGLSVKSSEFFDLSVKRKHCGVGD